MICIKYKYKEITGRSAMNLLGLRRDIFYRLIKEYEIDIKG